AHPPGQDSSRVPPYWTRLRPPGRHPVTRGLPEPMTAGEWKWLPGTSAKASAGRYRPIGGGAGTFGVFAVDARWRGWLGTGGGRPCRQVSTEHVDRPPRDVDLDPVAVADPGDRAAQRCLGCDVPDHQPPRGAADPAVGYQRHRVLQAAADDSRGDLEHLRHARAAAGAFVPDDHRVASGDLAAEHGGEGVVLPVEHPRPAAVMPWRRRRHLDHRPLGGGVAAGHAQATFRAGRGLQGPDVMTGRVRGPP